MKNTLCFIFLLLIAVQLQAQNNTDAMLFGHVTSKRTGEHIPYVGFMLKAQILGLHRTVRVILKWPICLLEKI